jgi:hypothetical protein
MTNGKAVHMRTLKLAALGVLALGVASQAAYTNLKTGVSAQASMLDQAGYNTGVGVNGFVQSEHAMGMGAGGLGLRANFDNYMAKGGEVRDNSDIQEGGVALTAMGGPNTARFQPRIGGHVGYAREEQANFLDVGPDVMASLLFTPHVGLNALVTPTWFINGDRTDYLGTKVGVGVTWNVPGA